LRLPGAFDGFEIAVRAILGQQVTVKGASTLAGRFAEALGTPIETPHADLHLLFPAARTVSTSAFSIGVPRPRIAAIRELARAVVRGDVTLAPHADVETSMQRLLELPGIGPWTAHYIAMRALHWPDAYPEGDLVLRRAEHDSETWRPWRAYGAMHVWRNHAGDVEDAPERLRAVGDR
jgi:AraC family transcriptional regulator of adaptative response / DNA-3-methyladenine glycosylase II